MEAAENTEGVSGEATRPDSKSDGQNANQHFGVSRQGRHIRICKASVRKCRRRSEPLTVTPEHMDVQLLKEIHDKRVDLWQQTHEEDDGKTQDEDCGETHTHTTGQLLLSVS